MRSGEAVSDGPDIVAGSSSPKWKAILAEVETGILGGYARMVWAV